MNASQIHLCHRKSGRRHEIALCMTGLGPDSMGQHSPAQNGGTIDKSELLFILMIRQPDFVTENYARETIERTKKKKPNRLLEEVRFERILKGRCIQMLHVGSYDDEPASFKLMEEYARGLQLERAGRQDKEIYLSDPGRVEKDKLKTVLRFKVQQRHSTQ